MSSNLDPMTRPYRRRLARWLHQVADRIHPRLVLAEPVDQANERFTRALASRLNRLIASPDLNHTIAWLIEARIPILEASARHAQLDAVWLEDGRPTAGLLEILKAACGRVPTGSEFGGESWLCAIREHQDDGRHSLLAFEVSEPDVSGLP